MDEEETLDYPRMVREALRGVVRQALARVAEEGLPDDHHFFIAFKTAAPGVHVPALLRDLHPEEMTIVLQHQFWDLDAGDDAFSVTLIFGGARHRLTVPYSAVITFADPAASFGLRFEAPPEGGQDEDVGAAQGDAGEGSEPAAAADPGEETPGKVVRLDRFRPKE